MAGRMRPSIQWVSQPSGCTISLLLASFSPTEMSPEDEKSEFKEPQTVDKNASNTFQFIQRYHTEVYGLGVLHSRKKLKKKKYSLKFYCCWILACNCAASHDFRFNHPHIFSGSLHGLATTLLNPPDTAAAVLWLLKDFKRWGTCRY